MRSVAIKGQQEGSLQDGTKHLDCINGAILDLTLLLFGKMLLNSEENLIYVVSFNCI